MVVLVVNGLFDLPSFTQLLLSIGDPKAIEIADHLLVDAVVALDVVAPVRVIKIVHDVVRVVQFISI